MPQWTEEEFTSRARLIAQTHATSKQPINDLAEKVARDEALNPEEIRTLVRLSNVAAFQELFKRKDDGDKMVEFDTGDPEQLIRRMTQGAPPPQSANIHNDKLAAEVPDLMREKRLGRKFDAPETEKVASESDAPRAPRRDMVILNLRKLAEEFRVESVILDNKWEAKVAALAIQFKRPPGYGPDYVDFEKDAYAEYGENALPELTYVCQRLRRPAPSVDSEKVAALTARHVTDDTRELRLMKEAFETRQKFTKVSKGLSWLTDQLKKYDKES